MTNTAQRTESQAMLAEHLDAAGAFDCTDVLNGEDIPGCQELLQIGKDFACGDRVANCQALLDSGDGREGLKDFLVKYRSVQRWKAEDAIVRFAMAPLLLDVVADTLGEAPILQSADIWAVLPSQGRNRQWSQTWHRDPEDARMLKMFLYLSDVDDESGPFEYLLESHRRDFDLCAPHAYLPVGMVDSLPSERIKTFTGSAGTLVMAQTCGLHRGGYGSKLRVSATWTYTSVRNTCRMFRVPEPLPDSTPEQLFALGFA